MEHVIRESEISKRGAIDESTHVVWGGQGQVADGAIVQNHRRDTVKSENIRRWRH